MRTAKVLVGPDRFLFYMLPKRNRLPRQEFKNLFGSKTHIKTPPISVFVKNNRLLISRFGIVVNTSMVKKAHSRNRCKRLVREIIRQNLHQIKTGKDVVVVVGGDISERPQQEVMEILIRLLKSARAQAGGVI